MEQKNVIVERLTKCTKKITSAINRLLPQLSTSALFHDVASLKKVLMQKDHYVFVARDNSPEGGGKIVGMAAIFFENRLEGWLAEIHSVTVDKDYRRYHIGDQITCQLVSAGRIRAQQLKRNIVVYLTCRPSRVEANNMYKKYEFKLASECPKLPNGEYDPDGTNTYRRLFNP